ncbi:unnamed protein product [Owenia fusiformis]|uniref:Cornifelin n=1 Tax=Owenia fusiformis TaxID=6347 RepID=A0A8S4NQU3_OWEFU|nr:unnamed protein product [Owenia fusiformis]
MDETSENHPLQNQTQKSKTLTTQPISNNQRPKPNTLPEKGYIPIPQSPHQCTGPPTVVVQQPTPTALTAGQLPKRSWDSGICDCDDDIASCCAAFWCPICFEAWLAAKMGEACCIPCIVPNSTVALRVKLRSENSIEGSVMNDCCAVTCCWQCSLCQMKREIDHVISQKASTMVVIGEV